MNTIKVRPVLVSTKNKVHDTYMIDNLEYQTDGKLSINGIEQELILISLEDEKIEVGDKYLDDCGLIREAVTSDEDYWKRRPDYKKIIARQSQIPPEYISKFIEQYNNNCVEDIEIEMEHYWINSDSIKGEFFTEVAKFEPSINDFDAVLINQPKLTNGFVTIVEKTPVLYTEEEVKQLLSKFGNHIMIHPNLDFGEEYEEAINWFENNKKK